ncbi:MAG TPA: transposase [Candidatus Thermoplasmatota archaeon]|nr:transposase [Candidatus Thermoplasmatota archaeon]
MNTMPWTDQRTPALAIVARGDQITRQDTDHFTVQSQSRPEKSYAVVVETDHASCDCDHNKDAHRDCIHILAARYWLEVQEKTPEGPKTERVRITHKQAWTAYNAAQADEVRLFDVLLSDLTQGIQEPAHGAMGRPCLPLREQAFCAIQKVYSQLSSRRARSLFGYAEGRGQIGHAPHFNVSSKFLNRADATPLLRGLVHETALPLAELETRFAIDSTGFRTTSFGSYCQEKHGEKAKNVWLKAHLSTGTRTHIVTDVIVTGSAGEGSGDTSNFAPLVKGTSDAGFIVAEVSADKAYSSRANHDAAGALGAETYIAFKSNASGKSGGSPLWRKAFHFFQLHRDEFEAHYHKRSNVESTIGAIKKKLGETLKSRNRVAQENELLAKVVAYNITVLIHEMHENGINPEWLHPKSESCTFSPTKEGL